MRGHTAEQPVLFSYVSLEERIPGDHPLRTTKRLVDRALGRRSPRFDELYATGGRPSVPLVRGARHRRRGVAPDH